MNIENIESLLNEITQRLYGIEEAVATKEEPEIITDATVRFVDDNEIEFDTVELYDSRIICKNDDEDETIIYPMTSVLLIKRPEEKSYKFDAEA